MYPQHNCIGIIKGNHLKSLQCKIIEQKTIERKFEITLKEFWHPVSVPKNCITDTNYRLFV